MRATLLVVLTTLPGICPHGQPPQPAGRLAGLAFEHSVWTLGQLVPYLRLNGVTPPDYRMPF